MKNNTTRRGIPIFSNINITKRKEEKKPTKTLLWMWQCEVLTGIPQFECLPQASDLEAVISHNFEPGVKLKNIQH